VRPILDAGGTLLAGYDAYLRLKHRFDQEKIEARQLARWGENRHQTPGVSSHIDGTAPVRGRST